MRPFTIKDPAEIVAIGFDFARILEQGETVVSATWSAALFPSKEPAPSVISGVPSVVGGNIVKQTVVGGAIGSTYMHRVEATTSTGRVLVLMNTQRVAHGGANA